MELKNKYINIDKQNGGNLLHPKSRIIAVLRQMSYKEEIVPEDNFFMQSSCHLSYRKQEIDPTGIETFPAS